jgi:phosphohistidine phosphatase
MRSLLLVRHAKSDRSMSTFLSDRDRPLNERGLQDAPKLGKALARLGFVPEQAISSPAKRALTTAQLVLKQTDFAKEILIDDSIYSEGFEGLLNCIKELDPDIQSAAIFGHNPTISEMIHYLLRMGQVPITPTGTMALIHFHAQSWGNVENCRAEMAFYLIPRLL